MEGGDGRGRTGRAAYGGGRHLELAQSAYRRSREAYQGANTLSTSSVVVGYVLVCLALILAQVLFLPAIITYFVFAVLTLGLCAFGAVKLARATNRTSNHRGPVPRFGGLTTASTAVIASATVLLLLFALLAPGASTVVSLCLFGIILVAVVALLSLQRPLPKPLTTAFLISFCALIVSVTVFGIQESGADPSDASDTQVLDSMVRGGMVNSDEYIAAVEVTGEEAIVVISSDVPGGYAESVCDFALGAALEYDNQNVSGDYIGITQATVREKWRPWSAASCSL